MKKRSVILILVLLISLLSACGNATDKIVKYIKKGDYAEAAKLYEDEILGNTNAEEETRKRIMEETEKIYNEYNSGKLDYSEAIRLLDTMDKVNALDWHSVYETKRMVDFLYASKAAYSDGEKLLEEKNYAEAIGKLSQVYKDDSLFEKVPEMLRSAYEGSRNRAQEILQQTQESGDWDDGIEKLTSLKLELDRAEEIARAYENDRGFSNSYLIEYTQTLNDGGVYEEKKYCQEQLSSVNEQLEAGLTAQTQEELKSLCEQGKLDEVYEFIKKNAGRISDYDEMNRLFERKASEWLEKAQSSLLEKGNYQVAIGSVNKERDKLNEVWSLFSNENSPVYQSFNHFNALMDDVWNTVTQDYVKLTLEKAENLFRSGNGKNYEPAAQAIRVSLSALPDNATLNEKLNYYLSYAPILLGDKVIENYNNFTVDTNPDDDYKDMEGNEYQIVHSGFCWNKHGTDHYGLYYLNAEYKTLSGYVYWPWVARTEDGSTSCSIYGDGELLYKSPSLTKQSIEPFIISVDVTGVRELKIYIDENGTFASRGKAPFGLFNYEPKICLGDLTIQK
ncbi:MAG: NPCBM/NEW2 domain-containing protein [Clostridiales bacterium]|nr:NPCBM/NEW2 domain-containing protein [Candidatus Apopatocola equi]